MWKDTALRIVSALVGLVVFFVIVFMDTMALNFALGALIILMLWEVYSAFDYGWTFTIIGCVGSMIIVGVLSLGSVDYLMGALVIYVIFLVVFAVLGYRRLRFSDIAVMLFATIYISCFMMYVGRARYLENGLYYVFLIFICAWMDDTGAYFTGKLFGKHKLVPDISPKKTVEGALGGIVFAVIGCLLLGVIARFAFFMEVNYVALALVGLVASCLGQLGDLVASLMKRQCGVKDFGNIMPGHGGFLDRFDSVILIAPFVYYVAWAAEKLGFFILR